MKAFKKRKNLFNPETGRLVFEQIIRETFGKYKDNIVCSEEILLKITADIAKKIREQLKLV
jgi:hypothetical protein